MGQTLDRQAFDDWRTEAIVSAWPDIVTALETHVAGFKKHALESLAHDAFDRAVTALHDAFGSAQAFTEALRSEDVAPPDADKGHLFHFAARWKQKEEADARVTAGTNGAKREIGEILVSHGNKPNSLVTQEEDAKRRADKKRNKRKT